MSNKQELYKQLDELGVSYDKRWGLQKLEASLRTAQSIVGQKSIDEPFELDEPLHDASFNAAAQDICELDNIIDSFEPEQYKEVYKYAKAIVFKLSELSKQAYSEGDSEARTFKGFATKAKRLFEGSDGRKVNKLL